MSTWHVGWAGQTLPAAPATIKPVRRKQQRRQEAYGPDWTGYLDALVSRYKDGEEWWTPIGVGDVGARQRGEDGLYLNNETELAFIREASRMLIRKSPLAQGLIEGLCNYIISDGYSYKAVAKEQVRKQALQTTGTTDDDALAKLAAACQEVLDDFHEDNHWADLEEELFWRSLEDGEFFLCEHEGDDGELQYRIIEPEQVAQRPGDPREIWSWGVGTPADDVADVQEYSVRWNAYGQEEWEDIPAEQIIHFKRNSRRNMKRGVPDFAFDTERLLRTVGKLYYNMGVGSSLQAAIAMVMQFATGTEAEITSMQGSQKSETITHPLRRANWDQVDYDAGTVQYVPEGQEWVDPPFGNNATAHVGVGQACCQVVANRWNAPGWFASGSMEDNNFASSVVAETPFNRRGKREQGKYRRVFKRPYVRALEVAVKSGRLPANTLELIEVQVTAPSLTVRNQLEEANENKIYVEMGVKSIAYVQEEKGIDGDRVAADRRDEQEVRNEQMQAEAEIQAKANPQPTTNAAAGEPPRGETKPRQEGLDASGHAHVAAGSSKGGQFTGKGGDTSEKQKQAIIDLAQKLANQRKQVFLVFHDRNTGHVDAISEEDQDQLGNATLLGKVYPATKQQPQGTYEEVVKDTDHDAATTPAPPKVEPVKDEPTLGEIRNKLLKAHQYARQATYDRADWLEEEKAGIPAESLDTAMVDQLKQSPTYQQLLADEKAAYDHLKPVAARYANALKTTDTVKLRQILDESSPAELPKQLDRIEAETAYRDRANVHRVELDGMAAKLKAIKPVGVTALEQGRYVYSEMYGARGIYRVEHVANNNTRVMATPLDSLGGPIRLPNDVGGVTDAYRKVPPRIAKRMAFLHQKIAGTERQESLADAHMDDDEVKACVYHVMFGDLNTP